MKYSEIATKETFKYGDIAPVSELFVGIQVEDEEKQIGEIVDWSDILEMKPIEVEQMYEPLTKTLKAIPDSADVAAEAMKGQPEIKAWEPDKTLLERFLGFSYPPKPPWWKGASPIEKFNYITLPISDLLGRIGGKIASDWRLLTKEDVQKTLAGVYAEELKWYQKSPEAVGWTAEKVAEYLMLKGIFKASGLHRVLTTAGQKLARPFMSKAIISRGGLQALKTTSVAGIKDITRKGVESFLTAAPENVAFISSWSGLDAVIAGKSEPEILEEMARGAGWGLALTAGLSVIGEVARVPEVKFAFRRAMANLAKKYPRAIDAIGKDIPKEIEKEWLKVASRRAGKDVRLIDLTVRERAMFRNAVRAAEKELLKAAEKEAAIKAYWTSKAAKAAEKAKPPVKAIEKVPEKPVTVPTRPPAAPPVPEVPAEGVEVAEKVEGLAEATERGSEFKTGQPVTFEFIRNTEKAPDMGERFQQHIEPTGRFMQTKPRTFEPMAGLVAGEITFESPLVIEFNTGTEKTAYDENNWKARLSKAFGNKTGMELSKAIRDTGYDGIVTIGQHGETSEIVDLTQPPAKAKAAEAKGEDITQEKLSELRGQVGRTSERYGITQARAGKTISKTEENMLARLPNELDLGPWSGVLLYSPELKGFSKSEHSAIIKLIDRGSLQLFRESRPVSEKYSAGFTYILRKTEPVEALKEKPVEQAAVEVERAIETTGEMVVEDAKADKIIGDTMPSGLAITPRFGAIREAYHRAHDWLFTFGQARREDPELYDQLMSAFGKRNAAVEKAISQMEDIIPKSVTLENDVTMAKVYEDKRLSPSDEIKDDYDKFALLLDELSKKQQAEGLFAQPFNERMIEENNIKIEKLAGELVHPEKSIRIKRLRDENAVLKQMRYLSHSIVAKRTIESKINSLSGDKKKAFLSRLSAFYRKRKGKLFLADYLKAELITKEDMRMTRLATEELADYYIRSAYQGLYDYAKEKGYIKPISEELRNEGWLNQKELGITAPELKDKLVHPILASALAEMKAMRVGRGSLVSQIFGMTKIGQFIKPTIVWVYDAVQKYMRGMYSFNPVTESKALVKATESVLKKDELYHQLNESNLFQFPYEVTRAAREEQIEKFIHQHSAEIDTVTKQLEKITDTKWLDPDMTVGKLVKNILMAGHRAIARFTWTGDKIQRTQSYLILRKFGYSHEEAVKVAASSHGGYSLLSEKYKAKASKIFFVYSFRFLMPIEMGKTISEPLIAAKDEMGGAKIPKHHWERMVKAVIGTALIPIGIDQYMKWRGFEKEGVHLGPLAWKWRKEVQVEGQTREIVIGFNYILNMPVKYAQRLMHFNPISSTTRGLQMLKNIAKWELHPLYRIFFWDINENRRSFGTGVRVYDPDANTIIQSAQIAKYIFGQSFRFYGGMMDAVGEGDMTEKERREQDEIFDTALSTFDRVLTSALGYKYTRQPLKERKAIMHKYLQKESISRRFEIVRKYEGKELENRKEGHERWLRKCVNWIENDMR